MWKEILSLIPRPQLSIDTAIYCVSCRTLEARRKEFPFCRHCGKPELVSIRTVMKLQEKTIGMLRKRLARYETAAPAIAAKR